ncbi:uncharacterized protein K452DRAFT_314763 [Aplosporella prunicola CBS 121167]|uniref:Extracellular membrane protein CFEM domain-containing protein n=1 Tax=Aplosporella prunicola CBS 121167 TaxID=1176127 RepID=A0A6A6BSV5_9PEZI|nr:uncharacterized protein K452DRAFT_314763 [Aplosporella prunicola CBS 121167]KAF2146493.1 hypothetical protein K452DRAFT_314763 [Aplosporella prunicola CBS 121167]
MRFSTIVLGIAALTGPALADGKKKGDDTLVDTHSSPLLDQCVKTCMYDHNEKFINIKETTTHQFCETKKAKAEAWMLYEVFPCMKVGCRKDPEQYQITYDNVQDWYYLVCNYKTPPKA